MGQRNPASPKGWEKNPNKIMGCTIWLFNIAMENYPFIDCLPIKNGDFLWQTVK